MGKIKGLFGLLLVVGGFYVAWNMIPPYFRNYQLQDDLDDIARRNSYLNTNEDDIRKIVVQKAQTEDIALKENDITVSRGGSGLSISVKYQVHVEMVVHPMDIDFTANSYNKRI